MRHNCQGCGRNIKEVGKLISTIVPTLHGQPTFKLCKSCREYVRKNGNLENKNITRLSY